ncbi:MAG: Uma2 family endonuclease [Frankiaceae bacterium]|nr:Uma2 family endonuclease [Frankiaceae bacterium]
MSLSPPHIQRGWTLADLPGLPDDGQRYELVDGGLVVTPPATQRHQDLASDLRDRLAAAAPPGWRVRYEYALPFADDTQRVPDVVVYRWPLQHPRPDERNPLGPPDVGLIVEVVSPRTRRTDRFAKPGEYAEAGIPLFWRLETEPGLVLHTFALRGATYEPTAQIRERGAVIAPWGELMLDVTSLGS